MWTVRYTTDWEPGVREAYCANEAELLSLVEVLQSCPKVKEFKVGKFLVQARDGSFQSQGYSKWIEKFAHENPSYKR